MTHSAVLIEATPDRVWPWILDINPWKAGAKLILTAGDPSQVGGRFSAVDQARFHVANEQPSSSAADHPTQSSPAFNVENVEIVWERYRSIRLNTPSGHLVGYASWVLSPQGHLTQVEYHVFCEVAASGPSEGESARSRSAEDELRETTTRRFQTEFAVLKRLVEQGR